MGARVIVGCFVLALGGCSVLFDGSGYETGSDAGVDDASVEDAGVDAGPPCDLDGDDRCCSWLDCANLAAPPFCSYDRDGSGNWTCEMQCAGDVDCAEYPSGDACISDGAGNMVCACVEQSDCDGALDGARCTNPGGVFSVCACMTDDDCTVDGNGVCGPDMYGLRMCVECRDNDNCDVGNTCVMGYCQAGGCPDTPPICGDGWSDCGAERWMPLEQALGVGEVGVAGTYMAPGTFSGATDLSVVMAGDGLVYVAVLTTGGPVIYRSMGGPLTTFAAPTATFPCEGLTSGFQSVQAMRLAADDTGRVQIALAGRLTDPNQALVLYSLTDDDRWTVEGCELYPEVSEAVGIAIAPDVGVAAALWERSSGAPEVQWVGPSASGTFTEPASSEPHWIGGSGDLIVGRDRATTTMTSVWFLTDEGPTSHGSYSTDALAGRGAFASASPTGTAYGHLVGDDTNLYLLRGDCSYTGSCDAPSVTMLSDWPPAGPSLYAAADLRGTHMVIANVGEAPSPPEGPGGQEVQLSGVPYTGDVPRPGAGPGRWFAPVFGGMDDMGPVTNVLDVAVDASGDTDHSDVAVAFLVDYGAEVNLGVRVLMLCDDR